MRVLVTGATGYVGGRLAPLLVEEGFNVRVLVRSAAKVANTPWFGQVEVVEGDAMSAASLGQALTGVDVAFYLLHSISTERNSTISSRRWPAHLPRLHHGQA